MRLPGKRNAQLLFAVIFACAQSAWASGAHVKVALFDAHEAPTEIIISGPCLVNGKRSFVLPKGRYEICSTAAHGDSCVTLRSFKQPRDAARIFISERSLRLTSASSTGLEVNPGTSHSRRYKGTVIVTSRQESGHATNPNRSRTRASPGALSLVNILPRRDYLAAVVASEMPRGAPIEALKAQAILANTQLTRLPADRAIEDSTQIQSYGGSPDSRPEVYDAVDQAGSRVLQFENRPVQAFFHSTCAGMTSKPGAIFAGNEHLPYLVNVKCTECKFSPFWKETESRIPKVKFETVFGAVLPTVTAYDPAGRPTRMQYQLAGRQETIGGYQFWLKMGQALGWDKSPGTRFSLSEHDDEVFIKSTGAGHGVGLCQYGAMGLARRGKSCEEILAFYFPGTTLSGTKARR